MPGGRPTKYNPEMCATVIEVGRRGDTVASMCKALGISRETMNRWRHEKPEFQDAVKDGLGLAQAWWEEKGKDATFGKEPGFNATSFIFNMKNRFSEDWRDRHEVTGKDGAPLVPTTIDVDKLTLKERKQLLALHAKATDADGR